VGETNGMTSQPISLLPTHRVAVIGTGASAVQIIPAIAQHVAALHVFQRSPPWVISRWNCRFSVALKFIFTYLPVCMYIYRFLIFLFQEFAVNVLTLQRNWLTKLGKLFAMRVFLCLIILF
jgi:hypothetical protein